MNDQEHLGDRTERLLSNLGITEGRYRQVKQMFGLPPTCACAARKEWLNSVSVWWGDLMTKSQS